MFDKAYYIQQLREGPYNMQEDEIMRRAEGLELNHSRVKFGPNVIHLDYYDGLLSEQEIMELETRLYEAGLELSRFSKTGIFYNSLTEFSLDIFFVLQQPIVKMIAEGFAVNIVWETVKFIVIATLHKIRGKYKKSKMPKFGIRIKFEDNKLTDFRIDNIESKEILDAAMDKAKQFILEIRKPVTEIPVTDYAEFNFDEQQWQVIDQMAAWRKKAIQQAEERAARSAQNEQKQNPDSNNQ
jgi:hypothetical protein